MRSRALPAALRDEYYVETNNDEEVVGLLTPETVEFLAAAGPAIHATFGCDARLMLAALWQLKDPIGPVLRLFVYTKLTREAADAAYDRLKTSWLDRQPSQPLKIVVKPV
jgi:hypothetical protein